MYSRHKSLVKYIYYEYFLPVPPFPNGVFGEEAQSRRRHMLFRLQSPAKDQLATNHIHHFDNPRTWGNAEPPPPQITETKKDRIRKVRGRSKLWSQASTALHREGPGGLELLQWEREPKVDIQLPQCYGLLPGRLTWGL